MRILILDPDAAFSRICKLTLSRVPKLEFLESQTLEEAAQALQASSPIDCVISENLKDTRASDISGLLAGIEPRPALVICSDIPVSASAAPQIDGMVLKNEASQKLYPVVAGLLNGKIPPPEARGSDYVALPIDLVYQADRLAADLYLRINHRFIHVFRKDEPLRPEEIKKYSEKGLEQLYVKLEDLDSFVEAYLRNHLSDVALQGPIQSTNIRDAASRVDDQQRKQVLESLAKTVEQARDVGLGINEVLKFSKETYPRIQRAIGVLPLTPEIESAIRATVTLTIDSVRWNKNLNEIFIRTIGREDRSGGLHSTLVAHVACRIAYKMGWKSHSSRHKLCLAAFLHDITLTSEALSSIQSYDEFLMVAPKLSAEEKGLFESHPEDAAQLALGMTLPPPEVETILRQHHETPGGGGFPAGLHYRQFHPLAAVFVVAEDWVLASESVSAADFIKDRAARYDFPLFREMLKTLRE